MNAAANTGGVRTRLAIAAVLVLCAIGLAATERLTDERHGARQHLRAERETIRLLVEGVLARNGIERKSLKTWQVRVRKDEVARTEQQVIVPVDFVTVGFNHELGRELAPYGARVVASERTKERTVTMHIISEGSIVHTISLVSR